MSSTLKDVFNQTFNSIILDPKTVNTSLFNDYLIKKKSTLLAEFLELIFLWKKYPNLIKPDLLDAYNNLISFITDNSQCCIAGSSVLCKAIQDKDSTFNMSSNDIDLFIHLDNSEMKIEDRLKYIFNTNLMATLWHQYHKIIKKDGVKFESGDSKNQAQIIQTSAEDYPIAKDNEFEIETFRFFLNVFNINIISISKSQSFSRWFIPDVLSGINPDSPGKPKIGVGLPVVLFFIEKSFDFENSKFIWDFQEGRAIIAKRLLIGESHKLLNIFKTRSKNETDLKLIDACEILSTQFESIRNQLERRILLPKTDSKYPEFLRVEDNPKDLRLAHSIAISVNLILVNNQNLYFSYLNTDSNSDTETFTNFPNIKISNIVTNLNKITIPRLYKYMDRGLSFIDHIGLFSALRNLMDLQSFVYHNNPRFKKILRSGILSLSEGALDSKKYSIDNLERQIKISKIKIEKESDESQERSNTGTL